VHPILTLQIVFFVPLALASLCLAWFGKPLVQTARITKFGSLIVGTWLAGSALLLCLVLAALPGDGKQPFSTLLASYFLPLIFLSTAILGLAETWSRRALLLLAIGIAAITSLMSPGIVIVATCFTTSDCL
jgi:hypothetical protein